VASRARWNGSRRLLAGTLAWPDFDCATRAAGTDRDGPATPPTLALIVAVRRHARDDAVAVTRTAAGLGWSTTPVAGSPSFEARGRQPQSLPQRQLRETGVMSWQRVPRITVIGTFFTNAGAGDDGEHRDGYVAGRSGCDQAGRVRCLRTAGRSQPARWNWTADESRASARSAPVTGVRTAPRA
jgi:hypothetical protein